uniref:Epidermal patterning factor-like protein n=1 Tax=Populus alba TaxID=43335 RepID=A0A4U5MWC1_POPAL|nr:EPIDERMAL PATTERNING FACTOR-like protein 1 [Populus alba]
MKHEKPYFKTIMGSYHPCFLFSATVLLHFLLSTVFCFAQHDLQTPIASHEGAAFEEKARLGSTPPSCHNKCNGCHPCMAVQVPTLPNPNRPAQPVSTKNSIIDPFFDPYPAGNNRYSNYKPLGWKCRCGDHFYNPLS